MSNKPQKSPRNVSFSLDYATYEKLEKRAREMTGAPSVGQLARQMVRDHMNDAHMMFLFSELHELRKLIGALATDLADVGTVVSALHEMAHASRDRTRGAA